MVTQCHRGVNAEAEWSTPWAARPVGPFASRIAIKSITWSLGPKSSKTSQFSVIRRFLGIVSHASESCYRSYIHIYTVGTSGVNRLARQICHNRLFRKKLQQNLLHMMSTEVSSLETHNTRPYIAFTYFQHFSAKLDCRGATRNHPLITPR
jgi:hypothetical protein